MRPTRTGSTRHDRRPSGCSLVRTALAKNGINIEEKTLQNKIWGGVCGALVRAAFGEIIQHENAICWIVAIGLLALGTGPANATTITETINFTASGFQPAGAPVDPVMGSFTITLDPTVDTPFTVPPVGTTITPGLGFVVILPF